MGHHYSLIQQVCSDASILSRQYPLPDIFTQNKPYHLNLATVQRWHLIWVYALFISYKWITHFRGITQLCLSVRNNNRLYCSFQ